MKKIFLISLAAMLAGYASAQRYHIEGDIPDLTAEKVYLFEDDDPIDSAVVANGRFVFEGELQSPARVILVGDHYPIARLFLEEGSISIANNEFDFPEATGTPANDNNAELDRKLKVIEARAKNAADLPEEEMEALLNEYESLLNQGYNDNIDNILGLALLSAVISRELEADALEAEIARFAPKWQDHKYMQTVREKVEQKRQTALGAEYTDFTLPDPEGNDIALSSIVGEGKYVLLDFWASWCGPCMGEIPHLVEAYKAYHDKGFEIFGVLLDRSKDAWVKCIAEKEMNWIHVSSLAMWDCPVRKMYGVEGIPASFLIGPDGRIVARDLRGEELAAKLAELLD